MRKYVIDFTKHWRPLLAASLGLSAGMPLNLFALSVLAPHLVNSMGWSKADFALTGMVGGLSILSYPLIGRLADMFGVRRVAFVGVTASALSYALMGLLQGSLGQYIAILILQVTLGAATTGPVYLRLVVQNFTETRGVALAVAVSMPPLVASIGSPLLSALIESVDWRAGCFALAAFAATLGTIALSLAPRERQSAQSPKGQSAHAGGDVRSLLSNRIFRLLIGSTILVSLPVALANSQLALVLVESGVSVLLAGSIVSFFAMGVVAGRLLGGLALDRFEAEIVGAVALSLPAIGMLLMASPFDHVIVLAFAVLLIGLASGAEGDLLAYLIVKHFGLQIYSTALGLMFAAVGLAMMLGAIILSLSIRFTGGYTIFLSASTIGVLAGCALLLQLRKSAMPITEKIVLRS